MARIVKSIAVVDNRQHNPQDIAKAHMEAALIDHKVLKGDVLNSFGFVLPAPPTVNPDGLRAEINRLLVEEEEAKTSLRELKGQIEAAKQELEELTRLQEEKESADILVDSVYEERLAGIRSATEEAEAQSQVILAQAEQESQTIRERARGEGYHEGYSGGYKAAEEAFRDEAEPKLRELADLITSLTEYGPELMKAQEDDLVQLAVTVAEKLVQREITGNPQVIAGMLKDLVVRNHRETYINISISPDMLPAEARASDEVLELLKGMSANITVYVEKEAEPGTLLVETPKGVTDMSVSSQLDNVREELLSPEEV